MAVFCASGVKHSSASPHKSADGCRQTAGLLRLVGCRCHPSAPITGRRTLDGRLYPVLCATSKRVRMEPDPARGGLLAKSSENGLFGPLEGWLADRFGPRRVASTGVLLMGFGFMVFSRVEVPLLFVIAFSLMAAGSSLAGFVPTFTAVCWQPAKVAHFETREIMGWMEVWRAP